MGDSELMHRLAVNLHRLMKERGVTQKQVEAASGIPQPDISRLLNEKHSDVYLATVWCLAKALEVSVDELAAEVEE